MVEDENIIEQHEMYESQELLHSDREYDEELVTVAVCLLRHGYILSTDMTAQLLEDGIDVETLTQMYGA